MQLVDIGANLTHPAFRDDLSAVLGRARGAGLRSIVATGTSLAESQRALDLSVKHPETVYATAGIHPHHASECDAAAIPVLRSLADRKSTRLNSSH